jgi:hypothetical protein
MQGNNYFINGDLMAKKSKTKGLKPGEKVPISGQYKKSTGGEVTGVKGKRLPPGPKGTKYTLADKTKHKK